MNKKTKILSSKNEKDISETVSMIHSGKIVAVPTETVYGLAADARNIDAVKEIFKVKNRPSNHPLIVHIDSFTKLSKWAKDIPPIASIIAEHFWPGPITLLLNKNDLVNDVITGGLKTIAIRVPQNKVLIKIIQQLNTGLAAPSANPYKRISPTTSAHVMSGLSGKIDAILDDGPCQIGVESTILDLTKNNISILRHGPITKKMIENVLKIKIDAPLNHTEAVPGNMKSHYQPYTKTSLMTLNNLEKFLSNVENQDFTFGVIHYSTLKFECKNIERVQLSENKIQYTKQIYNALHEIDKKNVNQILIESPPKSEEWADILDRLCKASIVDDK